MFLFNIWKYLRGYVVIYAEGYFIERFINLCLSKNIKLWDIKRSNLNYLEAKIDANRFKSLKKVSRTAKCRVRIQKKVGIPFIANRYKKRKIFLILLFLVLIITNLYLSFVWKIEVSGEFTIPIDEIHNTLKESGLEVGKYKYKLDIDRIKRDVVLSRNDITWIGIEIKGIKAIVEVVQKSEKPDMIAEDEPCNILADKEGVIARILTRQGVQMVKENELITKGQLLISGVITSRFSPDRYVHADGEIYIKTWYTEKIRTPFEKDIVSLTGKEEKKYQIKILNYEINLLNSGTKFEKYDKITKTNKLRVFGLFELPIEVTVNTYRDISIEQIRYTEAQAESIAINEAMNEVLKKIPKDAQINNNMVNIAKSEDGIEVEVSIECLEKVGTKEKIGG